MDVELTVDMLEAAAWCDHIVLFSGNGDFRHLAAAVKARGVRVSVVSTMEATPPMMSDELRREADTFIELADLCELIARPRRETSDESPAGEDD